MKILRSLGSIMHRGKRWWFSFLGAIVGMVILVILFASPIGKYIIEKYDERWIGRQVTLDWAYVNPFTGFVHLNDLKIYEGEKDTVFFEARGVSGDFDLWKLLSGTVELDELIIDHPRGTINQTKDSLNFGDIINRFKGDSTSSDKEPAHVNILKIKIKNGEFFYNEHVIPIHYVVRDLNLESPGVRWDSDTIKTNFSFLSQNGKGGMSGDFMINIKNLDYRISTLIREFDLELIRQYLWELINYGMFSAQLDARVKAWGNFKNPDQIHLQGRISLKDFHLGKTTVDDYASFKKLEVDIDELSPVDKKFLFDSITLVRPFFKYEKFDSLNNMEMLFGKNGSNVTDITSQPGRFNLIIEIGRYLKNIAKNFFDSRYRINRLAVTEGDFKYSDFSLSEQFTVDASGLSIRADSVDKTNRRIKVYAKSGIRPYGNLGVTLSINPKDSGDFDMFYHAKGIPATVFNPYLISLTSYPLDRGTLELEGVWNVRNGDIKSVNHLLMIDPQVSKRIKNNDVSWLPLPVIMAVVKERGNVIDYNIPISGNLKNPHLGLRDVIFDILRNIFVKPLTIPYGIEIRSVQNEIDNALTLKWEVRQRTLNSRQKHFVEKMTSFLEKNSEASITVTPRNFEAREKEQILFFEAKKKYFLLMNKKKAKDFSVEDSAKVDKMSVKDRAFVHYIKRGLSDTVMFTVQEKCKNFVGQRKVDVKYSQLLKAREAEFRSFFKGVENRIKVVSNDQKVPFYGYSCYRIRYQGDWPKSLKKAYEEMNQLLDENPSKKYFKKRQLVVSDAVTNQ